MSKILICGFPHCGTTILKSVIGHIEEVEEISGETSVIKKKTDKKYVVCKCPFTHEYFFGEQYKDYTKIFIIRNPLFVFSSLNKRFNCIPLNHSIDEYIKTIRLFTHHRDNHTDNVYTIRYEDLFDNNYQQLKDILDRIGITYTDDIFDNTKYKNKLNERTKLLPDMPNNKQHAEYRNWQINQPFISNNDSSKIYLKNVQRQTIVNSSDIINIYPELAPE